MSGQVVRISPRATSFTAVCAACAGEAAAPGWAAATFSGRLDLDIGSGMFLCRRGHRVHVQREQAPPSVATDAA